MSKTRLINRLKWYYPTEKFHAYITFPLILIYSIYTYPIRDTVFLIYGLIVCITILYQGQLYWKLKLHRLTGKNVGQEKNISFFNKAKQYNIILIGFIPLFFLTQVGLQAWDLKSNDLLFWGVLANVFAILEHVNYYHKQLMIDNAHDLGYIIRNKKLKKASLAKDLFEGKI